ncbi:MAG: MBL fold metallo-hydrolase, partial [Nitrososphaerota archaeon]
MKYKVLVPGSPIRTSIGALGASSVILIEKNETTILVDTTHYGRRHLLMDALAEAGLEPRNIDYVIITHLHWDHCLNYDLFENSQFLISKQELDYNIDPSPKDRFTLRNFHKLAYKLNIREITNNNTSIIEGVQLVLTPG